VGNIGPGGRRQYEENETAMILMGEISKMADSTYNLSFTAGALLIVESLIVAEEYFRANEWSKTAKNVEKKNLLQARTKSAGKRILSEVCARLRLLTAGQLDLLRHGSHSDQQQLLWLAVCKRYEVLFGFASDVVRNKFLHLELALGPHEFDDFLEAKSIWHPEIEGLAASTRVKLCQVALQMLREAGVLSDDHVIQSTHLSTEIARVIQSDSATNFAIFPISESDVRAILI